jgi:hypothetical protein
MLPMVFPLRLVAEAVFKKGLPQGGGALYMSVSRQQPKGGDPVSHCPLPRSPASVSWILASVEVRAA